MDLFSKCLAANFRPAILSGIYSADCT